MRIKGLGQLVAPRQTCLRSVVVCCANIRVCCAMWLKVIFAPSTIDPDNLRLQQPPFGPLSASAAGRVPNGNRSVDGGVAVLFWFSELRGWSRRSDYRIE